MRRRPLRNKGVCWQSFQELALRNCVAKYREDGWNPAWLDTADAFLADAGGTLTVECAKRKVFLSDPRILVILSNARTSASCGLSPRNTLRSAFFQPLLVFGDVSAVLPGVCDTQGCVSAGGCTDALEPAAPPFLWRNTGKMVGTPPGSMFFMTL
jgi:hypothetical protein